MEKEKHWHITHLIAFELLRSFTPSVQMQDIHDYFSHTNSAKCSMNRPGNSRADWRLYDNCRSYVPGEISALKPDILITQGDLALYAVEKTLRFEKSGDMKSGGYGLIALSGRCILWLHMCHPRSFGRYYRQKREHIVNWPDIVSRFVRGELKVALQLQPQSSQ